MDFMIGYQQPDNGEYFAEIVEDYKDRVAEVYFPWPGAASGRASLGRKRGAVDWNAQARLEDELVAIRKMGVALDLIFNANCYGAYAVSEHLENEVCSVVEHVGEVCGGLEVVTTTSLAIARTIKRNFPSVEIRASVNMRIGTVQAMEHLAGLFDSFYLQRDLQRNLDYAKKMKNWCGQNGKGLYILANSGCLRFCPGQVFHDNLVAHDAEIDEVKNIPDWTPHVCWNRYRKEENRHYILSSTWIRPEDLKNYDGIFDKVKLATRQHSHPRMVIDAYVNGSFGGNLLNLFEPSFAPAFAPAEVSNDKFPADWFDKTSTCNGECHECGYCEKVFGQVLGIPS
jgi:hypothetical protein